MQHILLINQKVQNYQNPDHHQPKKCKEIISIQILKVIWKKGISVLKSYKIILRINNKGK